MDGCSHFLNSYKVTCKKKITIPCPLFELSPMKKIVVDTIDWMVVGGGGGGGGGGAHPLMAVFGAVLVRCVDSRAEPTTFSDEK